MADTIRVLFVDDEPELLDIGKLYLEKSETFAIDTCISVPEALLRLNTERYDAIVSDYQMPDMDGIAFLKHLKASGNTTPFIIFTGRGREDVVIDALNNGADFYIQKGGDNKAQFTELSNKIRYTVTRNRAEEARLKKNEGLGASCEQIAATEEKLQQQLDGHTKKQAAPEISEGQFRALVENSPEPIYIQVNGHFVYLNQAAARLFGADSADQLLNTPFMDRIHPDFHDLIRSRVRTIIENPAPVPLIYEVYLRVNGDPVDVEVAAAPIRFQNAEGVLVFLRDITDRKRAEDALLKKNEELNASYEQIAATEEELRANLEDLTRQELALRESETRYRQFFNTTLDSVFITTPEGKWTDCNDSLLEIFGFSTRDEVFGVPVSSVYAYPEERAAFLKLVEQDGYIKEYPMQFKKKDGTIRDGLITIVPIKNPDGSVKEFIGTLRDITEFKNTQKALRDSEAIYQQLEAQLPDFVIIHEGETIVFVNAEGAHLVGKTPEQIIGTSVLSYAAPAYHELIKKNTRLRYQGVAVDPYEIEIITPSGEQRRVEVRATQISSRKNPATLTVLTDITDRKRAEEELRGAYEQLTAQEEELRAQYDSLAISQAEWESTFNAISDWITLISPDGKIHRTNKAVESLLGIPSGKVLGRYCFELIHGTECQIDDCPRRHMLESKKREITESQMGNGNGWVQVTVDPIINANGNVVSAVHIVRDISERTRSQKALVQAKKKLNLLNYVTFNDIRNSVFSLSAYVQIIKDEVTDTRINGFIDKQDEILQKITHSLTFSQSYQDLGIKPPKWQNANHVFLLAISHLDFLKINHTVQLEGLEIFADPLLEKVFQILADNTLTHGKTATKAVFRFTQGPESVTLFFEDDGVGIPKDSKKKIFSPDFQKKKGVGLFLAGEILDITGISLCETGEPGKGARFEMTIPKGMWRMTGDES
ncbi:MAG: PAS domain S-box protein [Methanoregula sp.]